MEKKYDPHCLPIRPAGILVKDNGKVGIEGTTIAVGNRENLKKSLRLEIKTKVFGGKATFCEISHLILGLSKMNL